MNRRSFIKSGALAASSFVIPLPLKAGTDKIKLAILGTGNWGTEVVLKSALSAGQFEIVALCDVNAIALDKAADVVVKFGMQKPKLFTSYREMYEMKGLQAVAIVTPTHWHALQFIDACKKRLHVFLEKPVSYDIREGQAMLQAHAAAGNVVQVDFPRVMGDVNQGVKSFIERGDAGQIFQVMANINHHEGPLAEQQIPPTLDFETFCGPAPRPKFLCENAGIPMWRGQRAFSRGILFDWGIHYIHNARLVLGLDLPDNVMSIGGITRNFTHDNPDHLDVKFEFGSLPVCWSHKTWGYTSPVPSRDYGIYYYGETATIFAGDMGWEAYTKEGKLIDGDVQFNPADPLKWQQYLSWAVDLFREFAEQVRSNSNKGISNTLEQAVKTTSSVIYADLAYQVKSRLDIDKVTMDVIKNNEAQRLLKRTYREPYHHPYAS